jgi:hypothetical protein
MSGFGCGRDAGMRDVNRRGRVQRSGGGPLAYFAVRLECFAGHLRERFFLKFLVFLCGFLEIRRGC